jgi:hypothetical protein
VRLRARCEHSCPPAPPLTKNHDEHLVTFSASVGWIYCEHLLLFQAMRGSNPLARMVTAAVRAFCLLDGRARNPNSPRCCLATSEGCNFSRCSHEEGAGPGGDQRPTTTISP